MSPHRGEARPWWQDAVVYQIYPRSFQDGDGDGIGDLEGIRTRLEHLRRLGVDAVWLSPIYPSPGVDGGYDIADHCAVDPDFGDLAAFDRLLTEAHRLGLRVLLDWVPNHTSDQHPWFRSSRLDPHGPHGDWYWWADRPPNAWPSAFGGPAWTFDKQRGQYYLHLFTPAQPDLNWNAPGVREAMAEVLRFWLDRGVDGFRADVVHLIGRDPALPDLPPRANPGLNDLVAGYRDPRTHTLLRDVRRLLDSYPGERVMVGEVSLERTRDVVAYLGTPEAPELHLTFDFSLLEADWDAGAWRRCIAAAEEAHTAAGTWPTWVLSSHDASRHRTRYGGDEDAARAAAVLLLTLRGTPFLYEGEEFGLEDAVVDAEHARDPLGRDRSRAPIPWTADDGHGWPSTPWLPWPPRAREANEAVLRDDPGSILRLYRRLLALRRAVPVLHRGDLTLLDSPAGTLAYRRHLGGEERGALWVFANFTSVERNVGYRGTPVLSSARTAPDVRAGGDGPLVLPPRSAVIVRDAVRCG